MNLTAAERVLVHLHGFWNAPEPGREVTQTGIAEGARLLRSHVPRTLRSLEGEGLVEGREARLRGRSRKVTVYALTPAGMRRARELLDPIDALPVEIDGRRTTLGDARRSLGLPPLEALEGVDSEGRFRGEPRAVPVVGLLQRDADLATLRRWFAGAAPFAVVSGSRGMGKTALGRAFAATVPRTLWVDLPAGADLPILAGALARSTGRRSEASAASLVDAVLAAFTSGIRLLVLDGYSEVAEELVETLAALLRAAGSRPDVRVLVLAQESTPAYCRFYGRGEVDAGTVVERKLRGLDPEGCRAMLGNPRIDGEALRQIYLLTKGCPLYLKYIREGDEAGLRAHSRFTKAEVRLLLYSGRGGVPATSAS